MKELQRSATLLLLISSMKEQGSWCGETHIQKATYFLQELLGVSLGFDFILYKFGPFSFDLKDHILSMRADSLLKVTPQSPYGPTIDIGENGLTLLQSMPEGVEDFVPKVNHAAEIVGAMGASELEALATAYYVTRELGDGSSARRIHKLTEYKPHIAQERAEAAIEEVDQVIARANVTFAHQ